MSIYCQCFIQWCICRATSREMFPDFLQSQYDVHGFWCEQQGQIELLANTCMFLCKTFDKKIPSFFKTEKMKSVTEVPGT